MCQRSAFRTDLHMFDFWATAGALCTPCGVVRPGACNRRAANPLSTDRRFGQFFNESEFVFVFDYQLRCQR